MTKLLTVLTILLVCPTMATAQQSADESQQQDGDEVAVHTLDDLGPREITQLLQPVCMEGAELIEKVEEHHGAVARCSSCPDNSSNPDGTLQLHDGYIGDFSGDGNPEALLATEGCGQGFNFRHSTVVLSQSDGSWTKQEFLDTTNSSDCEHIATEERDWLMCRSTTVGQGTEETFVSLRHLTDDGLNSESLVELRDTSGACSFDGKFRTVIDEQVVDDLNDDGATELALGLRTDIGSVPDGVEEVENRCDEDSYAIEGKKSLKVFTLGDDGPKQVESLESSVDHPALQDYVESLNDSEDDTAEESHDNDSLKLDVEESPMEGGF